MGADAEGRFNVVLDSDRAEFGGTNRFKEKLPGDQIDIDASQGGHGKPKSLLLPHIAPYQTLILEQR